MNNMTDQEIEEIKDLAQSLNHIVAGKKQGHFFHAIVNVITRSIADLYQYDPAERVRTYQDFKELLDDSLDFWVKYYEEEKK